MENIHALEELENALDLFHDIDILSKPVWNSFSMMKLVHREALPQ